MWEQVVETVAQPNILEFRMVKGTPLDLEIQVNQLLQAGYAIHGEVMEYVLPSTSNKIFIQPMVKYEELEVE